MPKLDLTLVTGFLGSGKTTLLQNQLERPGFPRSSTALIINDAGPVNIDARVLRGKASRIEALTGGCACCVTPRQLVEAIVKIAAADGIERVWIEASGVAEPEELLERLTDTDLLDKAALRAVVHVIDAAQFQSAWMPAVHHKEHVRWADVVVLSRADRLSPGGVEKVARQIGEWNPRARVLPAAFGDCVLPEVEHAAALGAFFVPKFGGHTSYRSVFVPMEGVWQRKWVEARIRALPDQVVRAKGFLRFSEDPEAIQFLQYAGATGVIERWKFGADDVPLGLVCIGRMLEEPTVRAHFEEPA